VNETTGNGFAALVLAAGYSSRMGEFKPLLPVGSSTAIERAIEVFTAAGITEIAVVTGHRAGELRPLLGLKRVREVYNAEFASGMYSSVRAGIRALAPEVAACFLLPADIPMVRPHTVRLLAASFRREACPVIYPVFQRRRGHPPLIRRDVLLEVLDTEPPEGLRSLLTTWNARDIEVANEGILRDMDTPADLARVRAFAECGEAPTAAECREILSNRGVDQRIVRHSRAVALTAEKLALSLNSAGAKLDVALIRAAAFLHDVAKGQPDHPAAGAAVVCGYGFPAVARVIAAHRDLEFTGERLSEEAVVYLADKLVAGDALVPLEDRFERARSMVRGNREAEAAVARRYEAARSIARAVEARAGRSLEEIVAC